MTAMSWAARPAEYAEVMRLSRDEAERFSVLFGLDRRGARLPYGTVGSRLSRARRKLREALGGVNPMRELEENGCG